MRWTKYRFVKSSISLARRTGSWGCRVPLASTVLQNREIDEGGHGVVAIIGTAWVATNCSMSA